MYLLCCSSACARLPCNSSAASATASLRPTSLATSCSSVSSPPLAAANSSRSRDTASKPSLTVRCKRGKRCSSVLVRLFAAASSACSRRSSAKRFSRSCSETAAAASVDDDAGALAGGGAAASAAEALRLRVWLRKPRVTAAGVATEGGAAAASATSSTSTARSASSTPSETAAGATAASDRLSRSAFHCTASLIFPCLRAFSIARRISARASPSDHDSLESATPRSQCA
mmetsp:Transcript_54443/g.151678  ORF Transcript_54443/g.151678 Transcript_54443/m.151678 type:complete len:230 (+) Transcript_54443:468-1157(+)